MSVGSPALLDSPGLRPAATAAAALHAAADLGIAMGRHGSDLALDTADAVVVCDDLTTVPAAVALSRRARRVITGNLGIAASFITVLAARDLFATLSLPLGVPGHEGSAVIVGLNGLRLLRRSAWPHPDPLTQPPARAGPFCRPRATRCPVGIVSLPHP